MTLRTPSIAVPLAAAGALVALGAGAAPALAKPKPTPLVQTIERLDPQLRINYGPYDTAAQARRSIAQVSKNLTVRERAVREVAGTKAEPIQQAGKRLWLAGTRLSITTDRQMLAGYRLVLAGHPTAAARVFHQTEDGRNAPLNRSNVEIVHAERMLHVQ